MKTKRPMARDGLRRTLTGNSWSAMMSRCFNPNYNVFKNYGANGITVCAFIKQRPSSLISLIGERPCKEMSIDRWPDNHGNYSCGQCDECREKGWHFNVRWATQRQQSDHRDTTVIVEIGGIKQNASRWAEQSGLNVSTILRRARRGTLDAAILNPVRECDRPLEIDGETKLFKEWAKQLGLTPPAFAWRVKHWPKDKWLLPPQAPRQVFRFLPC